MRGIQAQGRVRQLALFMGIAAIIQASAIPCNYSGASASYTVRQSNDLIKLAKAVNCSGGSFLVDWNAVVATNETIRIYDGSVLSISGASDHSSLVDGMGHAPIFEVHNSTLNLSNMMVVNAGDSELGAIVAFESSITVTSCVFSHNVGSKGAAISIFGSKLDVEASIWTNNSATLSGGAIHAEDSIITFGDGVSFTNNGSPGVNFSDIHPADQGWGGAIYMHGSTLNVLRKAEFVGNFAEDGGAIFILDADVFVYGHVLFARNVATVNGGAIYGEFASVSILGTVIWKQNFAPFGGGVFVYNNNRIEVTGNVTFDQNRANEAGGIWISTASILTVYGTSTFISNEASYVGAGVIVVSSTIFFTGVATFLNNSAPIGGCVSTYGAGNVNIGGRANLSFNTAERGAVMALFESGSGVFSGNDVTIMGNRASSIGGAIYAEAVSSSFGLTIDKVSFFSNSAGLSGGAIALQSVGSSDRLASIVDCIFEKNKAGDSGGGIMAGGFVSISGCTFSQNVAGNAGGAVLAVGEMIVRSSIFYRNWAVLGPAVANTVSLTISTTEFDGNTLFCDDSTFLDWVNGSAYGTACDSCPRECDDCLVRNANVVQHCEPLIEHTKSDDPEGDLMSLELESGYWRETNMSRNIVGCFLESACQGGIRSYCAAGYMGPYCTVCIEGYARGFGRTCSRCTPTRRRISTVFLALALVIIFFTLAISIWYSRSDHYLRGTNYPPEVQPPGGERFYFRRSRPFQAIKTVLVAWQIISQFTTIAGVTYPEVYEVFLRYIDFANLDLAWILSAGCLIGTDFYHNLLMTTLGPLAISATVLASYYSFTRHRNSAANDSDAVLSMKHRHISILFWLSFLVYSTASSAVFKTFACDTLESGVSFLRADYRLKCYTPTHINFMVYAAIMIFIYPLGIPLCYLVVLYRNRKTFATNSTGTSDDALVVKDLWRPYRPQVYYYEVIECVRRVLLSGAVVFVSPNTAGQVVVSFVIALFFSSVLLLLDPYEDVLDSWMSRIGHAVVVMSIFVALLEKVDESDDDSSSKRMFGVALVAANCAMIGGVVLEACASCLLSVRDTRDHIERYFVRNAVTTFHV